MMSSPDFQSNDCASTTLPSTHVSKCRCGPVTRMPVWPTTPSCSEARRESPSRTMTSLRWLYVVFMPFAWETSTRLPPHTSQNTAVTVPSRAATAGVPSGAEMSVPLWNSRWPVSGAVRQPNSPPLSTTTGCAGAIRVLTGSSPSKVAGARVLGATEEAAPLPVPGPPTAPDPPAPADPTLGEVLLRETREASWADEMAAGSGVEAKREG